MNYICHSGGCPGADMTWEIEGNYYGVKTIAYSFYNHVQKGKNQKILTVEELTEGYEHVKIASVGLKRNPNISSFYVRNLLCRNWFQIKNSESVFAIGKFIDTKTVSGGTGWAVQMAIDNKKTVYVFDQEANLWTTFIYPLGYFVPINEIPKLTENFAGVGTREINENGVNAIQTILKENLSEKVELVCCKCGRIVTNECHSVHTGKPMCTICCGWGEMKNTLTSSYLKENLSGLLLNELS